MVLTYCVPRVDVGNEHTQTHSWCRLRIGQARREEANVIAADHTSHGTSNTLLLQPDNDSPFYPLVSVYPVFLFVAKPVLSDDI
jgi:hypothetical protein